MNKFRPARRHRRHRGRAPVHGDARHPQTRVQHHDVGSARDLQDQRGVAQRGLAADRALTPMETAGGVKIMGVVNDRRLVLRRRKVPRRRRRGDPRADPSSPTVPTSSTSAGSPPGPVPTASTNPSRPPLRRPRHRCARRRWRDRLRRHHAPGWPPRRSKPARVTSTTSPAAVPTPTWPASSPTLVCPGSSCIGGR